MPERQSFPTNRQMHRKLCAVDSERAATAAQHKPFYAFGCASFSCLSRFLTENRIPLFLKAL
jgi:hypothetical protein